MKTKSLFFVLVAIVFVASGMVATTPSTEAACSYPGYLNSNGQCVVSYYNTQPVYYYQPQPQVLGQSTYGSDAQLRAMIAQLEQTIRQLQAQLQNRNQYQYTYYTDYNYDYSYGDSEVDVRTRSATDIEDEEAVLRAEIDMNDSDRVTVWFEYGESSSRLDEDTTRRVFYDDDDLDDYRQRIVDLDDDTKYYFRAVARDEDGYIERGSILSFRTDDDDSRDRDDDDDEPDVYTEDAEDIDEDSAELHGEVDMNDFDNGEVFFVYGEDEDQIEDIEDEYDSYSDIDEDGDDLQKVRVDSDLDDDASYYAYVSGLDDDTNIYFSICVGYEDEDDDEVIKCGDVEDFRTDD